MNKFTFNNSILKSIKDYDSVIKATVVDRRLEHMPDGNLRSKFVASRQVTIFDPEIMKLVRSWLQTDLNGLTGEAVVNVSGYFSSTLSEKTKKWYDNQVVTELEIVG